uniref:uncharacterized protein isoform X1 n=1 Tax=Myxine glutinosa TaxID=7769 RepID=UPI00358E4DD9
MESYFHKLDDPAKTKYKSKTVFIGSQDPYSIAKKEWTRNQEKFPSLCYLDIVNYLVFQSGQYSMEDFKKFKTLFAYDQFMKGRVGDVCVYACKDDRKLHIVKAQVIDSQSTNETTFYPWLIVEREGTVVTTHCDCAQGMDESCSHIGTLMFALEAAVRLCGKRTALQDPSYRKFPKTRAGISYTPLQKINFTSPKAMKKSKEQQNDPALLARIPKPKEKKVIPAPSTEEINTFYKAIAPVRPAILSLHPEYSDLYIPKSLSVNCENEDK